MNFARLRLFSSALPLLLLTASALAQDDNGAGAAAGAASSAFGCAACGGFLVIIPIVFIALGIALLVWVARDAKSRGMDSSVLWMLLVFFTNIIGLIIYLLARPQGNLTPCANCGNKRLQASVKCPHCGITS